MSRRNIVALCVFFALAVGIGVGIGVGVALHSSPAPYGGATVPANRPTSGPRDALLKLRIAVDKGGNP